MIAKNLLIFYLKVRKPIKYEREMITLLRPANFDSKQSHLNYETSFIQENPPEISKSYEEFVE